MKPKIYPILEQCIRSGAALGARRANKHSDNPTEEHIAECVEQAIMEQIYEWFDFEGVPGD